MKITKIEQPIAQYGIWRVYQDGSLRAAYKTPAGRESTIHIYPERLREPDLLISIMADKVDSDWNALVPAFLTACRIVGIKSTTFQIDFE